MKILFKITFILFIITPLIGLSQNSKQIRKLYDESQKYFYNEDFQRALPILLQLDSLEPNNYETKYYIGICYLNSQNVNKALPYIEYALDKKESSIPYDVFKDIGKIYHKQYQFDKALICYKKYLKQAPRSEASNSEIIKLVDFAKNGRVLLKDTVDVKISKLSSLINTSYDEIKPIISADESVLVFSQVIQKKDFDIDSIRRIMICSKINGEWSNPDELIFNDDINYELAGLSSDGSKILLSNNSNLFIADIKKNICNNIILLEGINSEFWEYHASITPDGNEIYFSSNRLGGYGGIDIYRVKRKLDGTWTEPENLGNKINSSADEDFPVIHPDKQTLYYVSSGSGSIGGYDIFKSMLIEKNNWTKPKNIGYPINSTDNDISFSISASAKIAYISRKDEKNNWDIHKIVFNNTVPLTLVKGKILAGNPLKPINANIKVIDKEKNQPIRYVYNPNPETGKFLMIFPPGKNYDIIIQSDKFLPQLVNIYVPNQSYFYELFQEIHLKPITTLGKVIGEEVTVKNTFYDVLSLNENSLTENSTKDKNYEALINLIEDIINTTDSIKLAELDFKTENLYNHSNGNKTNSRNYSNLLDLVKKAIETTDSTTLELLNSQTIYDAKTSQKYFYSENNKNLLVPYIVDNDTIYTTPHINTSENETVESIDSLIENINSDTIISLKEIDINNYKTIEDIDYEKRVIFTYNIDYNAEKIFFNEKHKIELQEIAHLLLYNNSVYVDIVSYYGDEKQLIDEFSISKLRINKISELLVKSGMPKNKFNYFEEKNKQNYNTINLYIHERIKKNNINDNKSINIEKKSFENDIIIYKVQLRASMKQENIKSQYFKGLNVERYYHSGLYKFVTGEYQDLNQANFELEKIKKLGFNDAFLVVFKNGNRVEYNEAKKYLNIEN